VERFAVAKGIVLKKDNHYQALVGREAGIWLVLPQTFMNASGRAVQLLAGFFKIPAEEILVVHDELDFPPGTARIKQGGGIAGHNGLKDISQRLGSHDYWRLRLGVGRPAGKDEGADFVLEKPAAEEREAIEGAIARALEVMPLMLAGDMQGAMQKLHGQDKPVVKKAEQEKPETKEIAEKKAQATQPVAKPAEPRRPAPAAPQPPAQAKPERGLKGFFKSLTGSKK
jgi:PTH1 family peptidyl-tRNA hydrolase